MTDFETVALPAGSVLLPDPRGPGRRTVRLAPFEIGVSAVTEGQLAELIGVPASSPRRAARAISWLRAVRVCNAASEWEGLDPAYRVDGEEVAWDVEADGYRLPTEAEWEYASRSGGAGPRASAPGGVPGSQAADRGPAEAFGPLALSTPWEWCWDPFDPSRDDGARVLLGGGFAPGPARVRASARRGAPPRLQLEDVGFRLARGALDEAPTVQGWTAAAG